ncbi:hypothetical protein A7W90_16960 [Clostridium sp. Bc-iso-3]|nr:hypothetical protein A7W90_16960 [Clostridium sp. Bc-iso-3]
MTDKKPATTEDENLLIAYFLVPVRIIQNGRALSSRSDAKDMAYGNIGAIHNINKVDPLPVKALPSNSKTLDVLLMYPEQLINIANIVNIIDITKLSDNKALYRSIFNKAINVFIVTTLIDIIYLLRH